MKMIKMEFSKSAVIVAVILGLLSLVVRTGAQTTPAAPPPTSATSPPGSDNPLLDTLIEKGILTEAEAKRIEAETAARQTNPPSDLSISRFKMSDAIKSMQLYGDLRFRYEYRGADNAPPAAPGAYAPSTYYRERFRYALRIGLRGDLVDDFSYGIRFETSNNPRSPWDTFGNNTTGGSVTPSDKNSSGIELGQAYLKLAPGRLV